MFTVGEISESMCYNNNDLFCLLQALHISQLPTEILTYIIRWVVSSDLDTRSLEDISMVSPCLIYLDITEGVRGC